jgi:transposase
MRGRREPQEPMFVHVQVEDLIPDDHPLRKIKHRVDSEISRLRPHFNAAYAKTGRPSVPPERLIKATMLQALFSIRSERQLTEQIGYNVLYRWFLDMRLDEPVWNHSTFSKNRERFASHGLMQRFFEGSVARAIQEEATSDEHFSVDGTLIEAWASMKSVRPKDEDDDDQSGSGSNAWHDFKGTKRSNATHESRTDPEACLARKGKGQGAILAHSLHALMDNRAGLVMDICVAEASGRVEREQAFEMLGRVRRRHWLRPKTLGADKGYDDGRFLKRLEEEFGVVPHVPLRRGKIKSRSEAGEARRRAKRRQSTQGYRHSQRVRKRVEEIFGWLKTVGGLRRTRFVGRWKTQLYAYAAAAGLNFLRLANLESG